MFWQNNCQNSTKTCLALLQFYNQIYVHNAKCFLSSFCQFFVLKKWLNEAIIQFTTIRIAIEFIVPNLLNRFHRMLSLFLHILLSIFSATDCLRSTHTQTILNLLKMNGNALSVHISFFYSHLMMSKSSSTECHRKCPSLRKKQISFLARSRLFTLRSKLA